VNGCIFVHIVAGEFEHRFYGYDYSEGWTRIRAKQSSLMLEPQETDAW
jgi:hypothetical protein